ncbi:TetR/AcrR family transcriptional regulator [Actinomadura sp. DC4]|uniref:TetR/AcrR family transcriptional regulator n=1 Tax=Actinomadura sp. DC4 TaxID=3055069 RepID=UPI0025B23A29|nr:TetR/AcrR family transcriptional regulator [Actinomadura sp. DC4]MDN3358809.1 TetR/AcrR family transcriptional regulator [Actinomadura sp. DC4]
MSEDLRRRRRGVELEDAILRAAWDELTAVGYARLSMEGVAERAQTGKQVLYRRWRNRAELVVAAMRHHAASIADDVPDSGELRGDVLAVLHRMTRRFREVGPEVVHGLMAEARDLGPEFLSVMADVMGTILKRAAERGEIRTAAVGRRVATLPIDLMRHEILLSVGPIPENAMTEIVDAVFLPLIRSI